MKFPRNARIFRGQLDAAPFAAVFFLLVIFVLLTTLIYTPGVHINLPAAPAANITGAQGPTIAVAVDKLGRYYYQNQVVSEAELKQNLEAEVKKSPLPMTLVLLVDKETAYGTFVRMAELARSKGIQNVLWQTLPRGETTSKPKP